MEDFEKKAKEQAAHKPVYWFRYVDDIFIIWPHGQEKLEEFLNHISGLHNKIQFTMEKEEEGHLPFLDIDIYRKVDGSLGHNVQGGSNMTGTDLCVNKPHCAAAVRPWESEAITSTLPPARVRTCSVLSGSC